MDRQVMNYSLERQGPVPLGSVLGKKGNGEGRRLFYMLVFLEGSVLFLSPTVPSRKRSVSSNGLDQLSATFISDGEG